MDIKAKIATLLFDFESLNDEAKEELDNGRGEDELLDIDEQVSPDPTE